MTMKAPNLNFSNKEETRKIVTPYAFGIHDSLLGVRLASPKRRLAAVCIDLIIIALLTKLPGLLLNGVILLVAVCSLFQVRAEDGRRWLRAGLFTVIAVSGLAIVFQLAFNSVFDSEPVYSSNARGQAPNDDAKAFIYTNDDVSADYSVDIDSLLTKQGEIACEAGDKCDDVFFSALISDLALKKYDYRDANELYLGVRDYLIENDRVDRSYRNTELAEELYVQWPKRAAKSSDNKGGSLVTWFNSTLSDLGLSFGWAAVYFSVLTAWWKGQTMGKRLFGIKVIRIDGNDIDLWESIGRYGGYSAGLATGLSGFLQIYWDANRQAIQDKISETVVIRPE